MIDYEPKNLPSDISGCFNLYIDGEMVGETYFDKYSWCWEGDYLPFSYSYLKLAPGIHTWKLEYSGDGYYEPTYLEGAFALGPMDKIDPNITIRADDIEEGSIANILITAINGFSGDIQVQVGDKNYSVHVKNGNAILKVPNLAANTYAVKAIFNGSEFFKSTQKSTSFKVTAKKAPVQVKDKITLTLKKVKVKKSAKKLVLTATLKINGKPVKGKKLTFKFNKKTYKAKTNKKGVAKVTIKKNALKKLKVGKNVKYQVSYGKVTKKLTAKVKK